MPKSKSQKPGPRKKLRPNVLAVKGGKTVVGVVGVTKAAPGMKLNRLGIVVSGTVVLTPPWMLPGWTRGTTAARGQGVWGVNAPEKLNPLTGNPDMAWKIPVPPQPPRAHLRQPPLPPQQLVSK